ncbi:MAG: tellurite resistance/C4-dicarboxylate transporter family protein [Firmicutes bacterium]|nr:tellurite resistance/C4-dicarboxylate transporter family protein [Bacillota bacterium]
MPMGPRARREAAIGARLQVAVLPALESLYPGYFALVMATGILSVAMFRLGHPGLSDALLWTAEVAYGALLIATAARALLFRSRLAADLRDPRTVFTFFTFVAASDVLGVRLLMAGAPAAAWALGLAAGGACAVLVYWAFGFLFLANEQPPKRVVNGGWLVSVVGTESLSILAARLSDVAPSWAPELMLLSFALWSVGVAGYAVLITFIIGRLGFSKVQPADLSPPYWISMGAAAISTVGGANLLSHGGVPFLHPTVPAVYAATLALWSWAGGWIPLLVVMGVWKYGVRGLPLTYEPALWSVVFPLGMFAVATLEVAAFTGLTFLARFARAFAWVAFAAWSLTFVGMLRAWARRLGAGPAPASE